jgi:hypothetical protein
MAKHIVITGPVEHDGVRYDEGQELTLPNDDAAQLVELGVIELVLAVVKGKAQDGD